MKLAASVTALGLLLSGTAQAGVFGDPTNTKSLRLQTRLPRAIVDPQAGDPQIATIGAGSLGPSNTVFGNQPHPDKRVVRSFDALGDYDTRLLGRALVPPDTMGAVGTTQYVQLINGAFGVFSKKTGGLLGAASDIGFWNQLGQAGTGGDPRIMFNHQLDRWVAIAFGANTKDINIGVSDTADALGSWKSTRFEGLAPLAAGAQAIADYPTLAMDNNALYIGTNNFAASTAGGPANYRGTSLFVLPIADIFAASGPSTTNLKAFVTPFVSGSPLNDTTRGFAIQGVNSTEATDGRGHVVAASAFINGVLAYDILNAGTAAATQTAASLLDTGYEGNGPARQPGLPSRTPLRNIDPSDDRIGSSAWELNGRTYYVHTVTPEGTDETRVRVVVIDTDTKAILQQLDLGVAGYDFYQGAIAVSPSGKAVVAYNRSGFDPATGKISILAQAFRIRANGTLAVQGSEILVKESVTPGYINGAPEASGAPAGRQRWGDYASVTLDPENPTQFWLIGEYAREAYTQFRPPYPNPPSGFSRWGQYVAAIETPEPGSAGVMLLGLAALGLRARRRAA